MILQLSLLSNVIRGDSPAQVAARTRELGFESVQFIPPNPIGFGADRGIPSGTFQDWAAAYRAEGIEVCGLVGHLNLLHPDLDRRKHNINSFKTYMREMREFGCNLISTETGTLASSGDWDFHPDTRRPAAWEALLRVTEELLTTAEESDVVILYEPYIAHVCHTPELGARLVREFDTPTLGMVMDPTNWFEVDMLEPERIKRFIESGFEVESGLFALAHAKDVAKPQSGSRAPALVGPGQGMIDYPFYLQLLRKYGYEGPLVIEHVTEAEIPLAVSYVQGCVDAVLAKESMARIRQAR